MKLILVLSALLLGSCGPQADTQAGPSAVNDDAAAVQADVTAALVPSFPNSTPVDVPNLGLPGSDSRSGNTIAMETDATPAQVAEFYRDYFRRAGTPIRADTASDQGGLISVARDGELGAMLTISSAADKTRITVTTSPGMR